MSSTSKLRVLFNAAFSDRTLDPVSDPEPPVPPLSEPDPGVFHHEPGIVHHEPSEPLTQPDHPTKSAPEKDRA
jgi:hypothetical protein